MSLKIRLARAGAKKRPYYHIVVADSRCPATAASSRSSAATTPCCQPSMRTACGCQGERIQHWMSHGALPTDRVAKFLGKAGLAPMPALREQPIKSAPGKKAQERAKEAAPA